MGIETWASGKPASMRIAGTVTATVPDRHRAEIASGFQA